MNPGEKILTVAPSAASLFVDAAAPGALSPAVDAVGMWYVARAADGISDDNWFGFASSAAEPGAGEQMTWCTVPHRHADGIGALTQLLAARGYRGGRAPQCRDKRAPGLLQLWARRRQQVGAEERLRASPRWRDFDTSRAGPAHTAAPASLFLSDDEYRRMYEAAGAAGVSATSWLLWALDGALRQTLAEPEATLPWVFPVNLRGAVPASTSWENQCSGLNVVLPPGSSPDGLHAQIRRRLQAQEHWWQWRLLTLGRWLGQGCVTLLYRLARGRPGSHAGSYSNLGQWPLPGMHAQTPEAAGITGVACTSPGSPAYPVSTGIVEWNRRLSLSCRVHPVIASDPVAAASRLLEAWRAVACNAEVVAGAS